MKMRAFTPNRWLAAGICGVAGVAVFQFFGNASHGYIDTSSLFWWWIFQWLNPGSETEHGWLILALSGWLLWRGVARDPGVPPADSAGRDLRAAIAALIGGLALHAVGFAAQQARISILALLLFTWGVLRLGGGRRWGAAAMFPLGFLVFAIPVNVLDSLGFWLRLWVVDASAWIAHTAGIAVIQSGTQLYAPDGAYNYDVAAACSGVRSLTALAALSLLVGYLNFRVLWKRALVLLLCLPLVYLGNVARITAIIGAAEVGGPRWGDRAHVIMGYGVFVIVLGGVLAASTLLRRVRPGRAVPVTAALEPDATLADAPEPAAPVGISAPARGPNWQRESKAGLVAVAVLVAAAGESLLLYRLSIRPPRGGVGVALTADGANPVELPTFLGRDWVGRPAAVTAVERSILPPDTGYSRMEYVASKDGKRVFVSVVLSGRDRSSIHRPEMCLVGQGWTIRDWDTRRFIHPGTPPTEFPATVLRVDRHQTTAGGGTSVVPQIVGYWFVSADRVVASHWGRIALDAWNRLTRGRADRWAYILVLTEATDGEPAALDRLQEVMNRVLPVLEAIRLRDGLRRDGPGGPGGGR